MSIAADDTDELCDSNGVDRSQIREMLRNEPGRVTDQLEPVFFTGFQRLT